MIKLLRYCAIIIVLITTTVKAQTPDTLVKHIKNLQATVQNRRLIASELKNSGEARTMPVGILGKQNGEGVPPILIDDVVLYPTYAEFKAYAAVLLPGAKDSIYFATPEPVKVSYDGGILGTARMALVNEKKIKITNHNLTILKDKSFVEFDCKGFKQAGLGVSIELGPNFIKQGTTEIAKGYFYAEVADFNDIIVAINIDPFYLKSNPSLTFSVTDAIIDFSDVKNASAMTFPENYINEYYDGVDIALWRGFYLKSFTITLPEEIKDKSQTGRKTFQAHNVLIDAHGFTGNLNAKNLITLDNGNLGGWQYSINDIYINLKANQITGAGLAGDIAMPISGTEHKLAYKAIFNPGVEYIFNVANKDTLTFNIFQAGNVVLKPGSFIEVGLKDKKFEAMANLSGKMSIGANLGGTADNDKTKNKLSIANIGFEQLLISSRAPYIHSGTFDLDVSVNIGTFSATVSNVKIIKKEEKRGLGFDLKVSLLNNKDSKDGFSADASLMILGKVDVDNDGRQQYKYVTTEFNRIHIDINQGNFSLNGELNYFKEDPTFGSGFKGSIKAGIKAGLDISVGATALFGSVGDIKYWYADAIAEFSPGITITLPLEVNGFAGGLYYGVKQKPGDGGNIAIVNSQTGLAYLPDANAGLGIRAAVMFSLQKKKGVLNGRVGFEVAFNKGGGLSRAMLMGNANFMKDVTDDVSGPLKKGSAAFAKTPSVSSPQDLANNSSTFDAINERGELSGSVFIDYDVDNKSFYANFKVYVNTIGGAIRGVNSGGLAGEAVLYFAPGNWYVHLGTPDKPIGLEMLWLAKTKSYFMVGKNLPGSPPPPSNVSEILGGRNMDYMRDLNALNSGMGIAFGSSFGFDTGDLTFLIFYARFAAGAGFDVMLKDYGTSVHCEGSSEPIGMNGWYANGQVYAFVQGKIGISVRIFGKRRKFDIIDLGLAAALQAKLPNPTWIHGVVGGRYRILGGLIKGTCRFEFTIGKECKLVGGNAFAEAGVEVIADVNPKNNDKDVDVFAVPQAVFNLPVGDSFNISDNGGKNYLFRAKLDAFTVTSNGAPLAGTMEWNSDRTVLAYNTDEVLPSQKPVTVTTKISFEENNGGNWTPYIVDGKPYTEQRINTFTTGTAPDFIPQSNVAYSYPIINQLNYYKNEEKTGYIKLKRGQTYLFDATGEFTQVGRIMSETGAVKDFAISYANNQVSYTLPEIDNNVGYELALIAVPKNSDNSVDRNVTTTEQKALNEGENDLTITTKQAEASIKKAEEKSLYSANFRSSIYSTFAEKLDKATGVYSYTWPISNGIHELGYVFNTKELFDEFEMNDDKGTNLVHLEADLTENNWYKTHIYPYVYENYPANAALNISWRNAADLGAPPIKAMFIKNEGYTSGLSYTIGQPAIGGRAALVYNLPFYIARDYFEIQGKIANSYSNGMYLNISNTLRNIVTTPFMPVRKGPYAFKATYTLPGINKITTTKQLIINNEVGQ